MFGKQKASQLSDLQRAQAEFHRQVQQLIANGTPTADAWVEMCQRVNAPRINARLQNEELISSAAAGGYVGDQIMNTFIAMTSARLLWTMYPAFEPILELAFSDVKHFQWYGIDYDGNRGGNDATRLIVTYPMPEEQEEVAKLDPEFVRTNPDFELDAIFAFGHRDPKQVQLMESLLEHLQSFGSSLSKEDIDLAWKRFNDLADTPIAHWRECPNCNKQFAVRIDHAVQCGKCHRIFTDPDLQPVLVDKGNAQLDLAGVSSWAPIYEAELAWAGRCQGWHPRPRELDVAKEFFAIREPEYPSWAS